MGTLKEEAQDYEPKQTLNIADLGEVPLDLVIHEGIGKSRDEKDKDGNPVEFKYKFAMLNEKEYRVPNPVFEEIQKILKLRPEVENVKIEKSGSGVATRYKIEIVK